MKDLCRDIILGYDFQNMHKRLIFELSGSKSDLVIENNTTPCALSVATVGEPSLFANDAVLDYKIGNLYNQKLIVSWQKESLKQVHLRGVHKLLLSIVQGNKDSVNLYTELDAYSLPRIDDMINKLAQYKYFSTFDLKSAYHQVSINPAERKYTGFEANGQLYQFCRIPFGVTNGVAVFQR